MTIRYILDILFTPFIYIYSYLHFSLIYTYLHLLIHTYVLFILLYEFDKINKIWEV